MKQFKGTPGPWSYNGDINGLVINSNGKLQAVSYPNRNDNESEMMANARLIASAPELLEALQSLIEACSNLGYNGDGQEELYIEVEKAEQIINKALGGE